jgi:hypothetical protein
LFQAWRSVAHVVRPGAVRAVNEKELGLPKNAEPASCKALGRWEDEGGRITPPLPVSQSNKRQKNMATSKRKSTQSDSSAAPAKTSSPSDDGRQRRAKATAKNSRTKNSGLDSRVLGHVSARGKRNQARRDSTNK